MAYQPTQFNEGAAPGLSAAEMNKLGTQYAEVKAELQKTNGTSDIRPDWSNLANKPSAFPPSSHTHPGGDILSAVAEANYATSAGSANSADKLDGKHWVTVASGAITIGANSSNIINLRPATSHRYYLASVYTPTYEVWEDRTYISGKATWDICRAKSNSIDYLLLNNGYAAALTFYYSVLAWE